MSKKDEPTKEPRRLFRFGMDVHHEPHRIRVEFSGDGDVPEAITNAATAVLKTAGEVAGRLVAEVREQISRADAANDTAGPASAAAVPADQDEHPHHEPPCHGGFAEGHEDEMPR